MSENEQKIYFFAKKVVSPKWSPVYEHCTFENFTKNCLTKDRNIFTQCQKTMRKHFSQKQLAKCFSGYADCVCDDTATLLAEHRNIFAMCPILKKKFNINFSSKSCKGNVECSFDKPAPNFQAKAKLYVFNVRDGQKKIFSELKIFLPLKVFWTHRNHFRQHYRNLTSRDRLFFAQCPKMIEKKNFPK